MEIVAHELAGPPKLYDLHSRALGPQDEGGDLFLGAVRPFLEVDKVAADDERMKPAGSESLSIPPA